MIHNRLQELEFASSDGLTRTTTSVSSGIQAVHSLEPPIPLRSDIAP